MIVFGKGFCVLLSITGSIYCMWLLWDCWKQAGSRKKPPPPSRCHESNSPRTEWVCQLVLAVAGICFGVTLVVANGSDVFLPLWQSKTNKQQASKQSESTFSKADFGVLAHRDSSCIDRPITGIECASMQVSDEQVTHLLRTAPELEWLSLSWTPITGDVLGELRHTPSLRDLSLGCPQITDGDLVHLEGLTNLRTLCLANTQVTDKGLVHLEELTNLYKLSLVHTQVTDDGLGHLAKLTNLHVLYLSNTLVTDKGLEHLETIINLHELLLTNTQVTDEGVRKLQQALPSCQIAR